MNKRGSWGIKKEGSVSLISEISYNTSSIYALLFSFENITHLFNVIIFTPELYSFKNELKILIKGSNVAA